MGKDLWKTRVLVLLVLGTVLVCVYYYNAYIRLSYHQLRSLWTQDMCPKPPRFKQELHHRTISRLQITSGSKNTFFVESSCAVSCTQHPPGGLKFNSRQACAVYSFAALNPDYMVYIFYTCPLSINYYNISSPAVKVMLNLNNVAVVEGGCGDDLGAWLEDSPLYGITSKIAENSLYPVEHLADALRLLLLWKFGGSYLDLDTVTIKSNWTQLGENWAAAEDPETVSNGFLNVGVKGIGNYIFALTLQQFRDRYNGQGWSDNGPILLTRIIREVCNLSEKEDLQSRGTIKGCGFTLQNRYYFYPIAYQSWKWFFEEQDEGSESWRTKIKDSISVHFWNKLSKGEPVIVGKNQPYGLLAAQFCAPIYYLSRPTF